MRTPLVLGRFALRLALGLAIAAGGSACAGIDDEEAGAGAELQPEGLLGKTDNAGVPGLPVETSDRDTQVWTVTNQWEDRDTPAARAAGPAWPADSGLTWDQKYGAWIQGMPRIQGHETYYETFAIVTPWGKTLPAPKLECAETAIFLRVTFAAWYQLPFYMTGQDEGGARVYFGHFGARTANGKFGGSPSYRDAYRDYSDLAGRGAEYLAANWPTDAKLRAKKLLKSNPDGTNDLQPMIAPDAHVGAYFDEIHLNKRAGHFTVLLLEYFGSVNLTDSRNTYNLKAPAVRAGDVLLERWQKIGIGHTLNVKNVQPLDDGKTMAELASGSMPRRQAMWADAFASKGYFTNEAMGGEGVASDGTPYYKLGGGLKRFRVAKIVRGTWMNTWMAGDEASWISDDDWDHLKTRPKEFENFLGEVPPEQQKIALLKIIDDNRNHLRLYPASCSARENRERAFSKLYDLGSRALDMDHEKIDREYRQLEDYVFAQLEYTKSKTCCWNSTTSFMHQIVMDYVKAKQAESATCTEPEVFMNENGGYQKFADFAARTGRAAQWKAWSEDEPCAQRDVVNDTKAYAWITDWCTTQTPPTPEPTPEPTP